MAVAGAKVYTEEDYYKLPENIRAELIDGQMYYQAAPSRIHQEILMELCGMIRDYIKAKKGFCKVYPAPFAVKLHENGRTIVEPDISVICDFKKLTEQGCTGVPDWIIEIVSQNNPGNDYVRKLNLYADAGVREYWIVDPMGQTISVYRLEEKQFRAISYTFQEKVKVNIYDDFWIDFQEVDV